MKNFENASGGTAVQENINVKAIMEEIRKERIDPAGFKITKLYDDAEIEADLEVCRNLEDGFNEQSKNADEEHRSRVERGLAAEYTFRHAIEKYGWLTGKINLTIASQYDDYLRGIDAIAEITYKAGHSEHLGLAIDFASGADDVINKLQKTFDSLDLGYSPSVKYFESSELGKQKNFKVPRIVIGAGPESLTRLVEYCGKIMNKSDITESIKQKLQKDDFHYVLLGEMTAQLSVFCNRLDKVISQAHTEKRNDIDKRAQVSLTIHKKALQTMLELIKEQGVDMMTIRKHIRKDTFAIKMGSALSALSLTPIDFSREHRKPQKAS